MKIVRIVISLILFALVAIPSPVFAAAYDQYAWQKPVSQNINQSSIEKYLPELNAQVSKIVTSPALAPLVLQYADQPDEGYVLYQERGRIITTLAMAYPYVNASLQTQIKTYVKTVYAASGAEAFWTLPFKNPTEGATRNLSSISSDTIPTHLQFRDLSTLHVVYGAWLYGDKTGDWATVQNNWSAIKTYYQNNKNTNILFGSLDGHIAMIRLARQFGDTATVNLVQSDILTQFQSATNPTTMENRQKESSYGYFYDARKAPYFPGQPWMYLNISPEVARFINDTPALRADYLNRLSLFEQRFSPWWLQQVGIFNRWTGDEGIGATPELMGMFFPAERWVKKTSPGILDQYIRSIPTGIGDSFWIEALVSTIEANGQTCWTDIRDQTTQCESAPSLTPVPSTTPSACQKADITQDSFVDLSDYSILVANFFRPSLTNPRADINGDGVADITDYGLLSQSFLRSCL